jgi:poly(beta-D-mannuronate) lyase
MNFKRILIPYSVLTLSALALQSCEVINQKDEQPLIFPAQKFDLTHWQINTPTDTNNDGVVDLIKVKELQSYQHPDFFYINDKGHMVFAAPNKAITSVNSTNTRSELHHMLGGETGEKYALANNFALKANIQKNEFAQVGGNLQATLKVNHVPMRAKYADKPTAFSVVVGQVHASQDAGRVAEGKGYGYGNEPLKIYYKKLPGHEYGSVFWTYELNLEKNNPERTDIAYPVWGNAWLDTANPGQEGIALNEEFSYEVNIHENIMYLTFETDRHKTVDYAIDLTNNVDAYGKVDKRDHPDGYTGDAHFFKAGAYNQCSTKDDPSFRYPACPGTGDWSTDKANGDYTKVTFMRLVTGIGKKIKN